MIFRSQLTTGRGSSGVGLTAADMKETLEEDSVALKVHIFRAKKQFISLRTSIEILPRFTMVSVEDFQVYIKIYCITIRV